MNVKKKMITTVTANYKQSVDAHNKYDALSLIFVSLLFFF